MPGSRPIAFVSDVGLVSPAAAHLAGMPLEQLGAAVEADGLVTYAPVWEHPAECAAAARRGDFAPGEDGVIFDPRGWLTGGIAGAAS